MKFIIFVSALILSFQSLAESDFDEDDFILTSMNEQYQQLLSSKYTLFPHKGTYLQPVSYNSMNHEDMYRSVKKNEPGDRGNYYKKMEAEFQISFMIPVIRNSRPKEWDLLFAYTHHSWWQVYNSKWSRPFRESNYMPELFTRKVFLERIAKSNFIISYADIGYVHQSNGQTQKLSRSWDRVFARVSIIHKDFLINFTGWYRVPESKDIDDNRDIYKYMGFGEIELLKSIGKHTLSYKAPLFSHHFSSEVKYSYPWRDRLRWFIRFQGGYGHSLIEYNKPVQRYGLGISIEEFFDSK